MAYWTREYGTGITICGICGEPKGNKSRCCFTAPRIPFETFKRRYFSKDDKVSDPIAKSFWDDYLTSDCKSLNEYIEQTTVS